MMHYSLTMMVAMLAMGLLATGHAAAYAQGATDGSSATAVMACGPSIDAGVYTGDSNAVVYTPVSQFSRWLDRMSHNKGTHSDKNKAWIGAGALLFVF